MDGHVRLEVLDGVGVIRLDRPPANAFDLAMSLELQEAIRRAEASDDVGAIVIHGGPKLFAAGADIKAMAGWGPEEVRPSVDALGDACDLLEEIGKVSIAAVTGFALGGGLELALACDLRYLADDAKVGQPEIKLGIIPGAGGTQRLARLVGPGTARELVYTGRQLEASEAKAIGLALATYPPSEVLEQAMAAARALAQGPRAALAAAKAAIRASWESPGVAGIRAERELFVQLFGTAEQREGMAAFLEKRAPRFAG
jgi:enoyl-CoA hydratase/carnithine racemase